MGGQGKLAPMLGRIIHLDPEPIGLEVPGLDLAAGIAALDGEQARRQAHALPHPRRPVVEAEADIEQQPFGAAEAEDGPGAHDQEGGAEAEAHQPGDRHQQGETPGAQAAMRGEQGIEQHRLCGWIAHRSNIKSAPPEG